MLLLVLGSNYLVMFVGWEGVGLCSYLLIGFWFKNKEFNNAARKAFVMNRIGDLGFLLGIILIFITFGSINYADVFSHAKSFSSNNPTLVLITCLLFVGAMGKSAQIPLYTWLPDAMAGPTPVSALIHAATMVTAGIYMIARSNVLYTLAPVTLSFIAIIGGATALLGAAIAMTQNDIKKVLAYSTVSQLGYMFLALGLGSYTTALFHLTTHAFFKALLFLSAGSVIHAMGGEQDIRKMGELNKLKATSLCFLMGTLSIAGMPFFAGFISKDELFSVAYEHSQVFFGLLILIFAMTGFYMFRLYFLVFNGSFRGTEHQKSHLHESPKTMIIPMAILAILSVVGGFINFPEVFGGNHGLSNFLANVIKPAFYTGEAGLSHLTELFLMLISTLIFIIALVAAYVIYVKKSVIPVSDEKEMSLIYRLSSNKFYVDEIYQTIIIVPLNWCSNMFYHFIENSFIDNIVNATGRAMVFGSNKIRLAQTGSIGFYIFAMVIGIIMMLLFNLI